MESLFGRYKNALVLMLVLLAQVVLLAMQVRRPAPGMPDGHNVRLWRYLVTSVITPPEQLAHNIGKSVRNVWSNYIYLHDLRQQNLSLKRRMTGSASNKRALRRMPRRDSGCANCSIFAGGISIRLWRRR